jgi:hypothetical protein
MAEKKRREKKRGPRGGIKHQPGRSHDRKSQAHSKERFKRKAARRRAAQLEEIRRQWEQWDALDDEQKKFRRELLPRFPRPSPE